MARPIAAAPKTSAKKLIYARARSRQRYATDREAVLRQQKEYRSRRRELIAVRRHAHYLAHREEIKAKARAWRENNRERHLEHKRDYGKRVARFARYGITRDDYERKLAEQGGICAFCNRPFASEKQIAIDHDHATGKVRGLVHKMCNVTIGWAERHLAAYLA